ncbi:PilD-dependent protein pddD [Raoultella terrigena]|uniref:PilD-dependent protein pddD n=1 Tax=Raoultella terrigena TaxID=577 RepID=A0A3P8J626_RAOTE|nr:PilD-dependent protein pddD [Raoultella terrigena]
MNNGTMRGFTLVEMLLALAILAALSVAAVSVLQNVIRADTLTKEKAQQIRTLQQTFSQMAADFNQIVPAAAATMPPSSPPGASS